MRLNNNFLPCGHGSLGFSSRGNRAFSQDPKVLGFVIAQLGTGNSENQNKLEVTQINFRSLNVSSMKDLKANLLNERLILQEVLILLKNTSKKRNIRE